MIYPLSNIKQEPKDARDFTLAIPAGLTSNLPTRVDLRQYTAGIEDQLTTSSCVANATVSALEMLLDRAGKPKDLSRLFNYWNIRRDYANLRGVDGGAYLSDGFKSVYALGIPAESTWAFDVSKVNVEPSVAAYEEAKGHKVQKYERVGNFTIKTPIDDTYSVQMVKATLAMGYPVMLALQVNDTIFGLTNELTSDTCKYKHVVSPLFPSVGGHAVLAVGYDDDLGGFIIENSWGTNWGDLGFGIFTYNIVKVDCYDAWTCTAFDGVAFAPDWSFLDVEPLTAKVTVGVSPSYKDGDLFIQTGDLFCEVQNGTEPYQYKWSASDKGVVFVTPGALTKGSILVSNWAQGESRSITFTCEVPDTSIPNQQKTTHQVLIRVTKAEVDRGQAYRLYKAAFNRLPDINGLAFWENQLSSGVTLLAIARAFIDSAEFKSKYGSAVTNSDFIKLLYLNVLGREADAAGLEFWVMNLNSGNSTKESTLVGFSESQENKNLA
jgi:hypothetical protein